MGIIGGSDIARINSDVVKKYLNSTIDETDEKTLDFLSIVTKGLNGKFYIPDFKLNGFYVLNVFEEYSNAIFSRDFIIEDDYMYTLTNSPYRIYKIDRKTYAVVATSQIFENDIARTFVADENFIYAGTSYATPGHLYKIDKNDLSVVLEVTDSILGRSSGFLGGKVDENYLYIFYSLYAYKIDKSNFALISTSSRLDSDVISSNNKISFDIDDNYVYVACLSRKIYQLNKSDMQINFTSNTFNNRPEFLVVDDKYLYFYITESSSSHKVYAVPKSDINSTPDKSSITLQGQTYSLVAKNDGVYVSDATLRKLYKFKKSNLSDYVSSDVIVPSIPRRFNVANDGNIYVTFYTNQITELSETFEINRYMEVK